MGTARYVGMCGAMSAIGGDPSAAHDNPAALGLYRRLEVLLSGEETIDKTWQIGQNGTTEHRYRSIIPQASVIWSAPTYQLSETGVLFNNFMFSYRRLQTYGRILYAGGLNSPSLGALLDNSNVTWDVDFCKDPYNRANALWLEESGSVHEYAFSWAMNISNQWFVGAGLQVQSYILSSDAIFEENFEHVDAEGTRYYNRNKTSILYTGVGCSFSAGLIYRPTGWLRLGFGLQTCSLGALAISTSGTLAAQTDSLRYSYAPDNVDHLGYDRTMPLHLSSSVAFQIGAYGLIALQYDYFNQRYSSPVHSLRAGIEVIPVLGLYLNAGYACESTFHRDYVVPMDPDLERQDTYFMHPQYAHYASVAIGYRGIYMIVQAAYQYRLQRLHLYAHENAAPYSMHADTHRIVLTLGWHHN